MNTQLTKYKGIHPGIVLERELKKRSLKKRPFALAVTEHPQTFNAITKGKRGISIGLALKIEKELGFEEGSLALLQTYYDIQKEKEKQQQTTPNLSLIRKILFWDTDFSRLDWNKYYKAVIKRVFERGNETEKQEIIRFYGNTKVQAVLNTESTKPMTLRNHKPN
ncbi:MAG TPA: plasmid maintenance system antidote protein [Crocinitomicaceae bacterium]|nr:plasmid maintenance system antidote protein [Crocinitomicaceae bacterium]